jgi:hypothetical protein
VEEDGNIDHDGCSGVVEAFGGSGHLIDVMHSQEGVDVLQSVVVTIGGPVMLLKGGEPLLHLGLRDGSCERGDEDDGGRI